MVAKENGVVVTHRMDSIIGSFKVSHLLQLTFVRVRQVAAHYFYSFLSS